MGSIRRPPSLQPGDKIYLLSTARKITKEEIGFAIHTFQYWGLEIIFGETIGLAHHQMAGDDAARIRDLVAAFTNPEIKAIVCCRGGYGTSRILDEIPWRQVLTQPKWLVGFSDVTALHWHLYQQGLASIHGIMPIVMDKPEAAESIEKLKSILMDKGNFTYEWNSHPLDKSGKATGKLLGGNLSIINHILGTASDPVDWKDIILFMEDIDEYLYHIDRLMVQLNRSGRLGKLKGLIVGHFTDMKDNTIPFGQNAYEIISAAVKDFSFPVAFGFPLGHEPQNWPVVQGVEVELDVSGKNSLKSL